MKDGLIEKRLVLAATVALVSLAGGCERRDEPSHSIAEARNTLSAAGAGGSAAAPKSTLESSYSKVLSTIKDEGAGAATQAINAAIVGSALEGQGELAAADFRVADARLLKKINEAKARLSLYVEQRGLAEALSGYDPKIDIARFDDQIKERNRELAEARQKLAANVAKVSGIQGKAKAKSDAARGTMESLGSLRERMLDASSQDRPGLAEELNKSRRGAEAVMKESEILEAEAAQFSPVTVELELLATRVEKQIASLNSAKKQADELAQSRAASSNEAARSAEQTANELSQAVNAARGLLADEVKPAFEAALSKLNQSAGKFGQARGGPDQVLLQIANGAAAQAVGSLQREYAETLARVSTLLAGAGHAKPPVPDAAEFVSASESLASESTQALEAALQQYEKAKSSFRSGGGSAEQRDQVDVLAAKVNEMWTRLGGKDPEESKPAPAAPEAESAPAPEPEAGQTPTEGASKSEPETPAEPSEAPAESSTPPSNDHHRG